jgi:hypothetical protein
MCPAIANIEWGRGRVDCFAFSAWFGIPRRRPRRARTSPRAFGLVPNFSALLQTLLSSFARPGAKSTYLDTPIPTLFKERLFVYLSRFCEVRYCITRHFGFALGLGRSAGDPDAPVMTITQVIRLLQRAVPAEECARAALARLEALAEPIDWPARETMMMTC